jgi:hypothetical protein
VRIPHRHALPRLRLLHAGQIHASARDVPDQILIACVAKLRLYGFRRPEGRFAELLSILEKHGATGLGDLQVALRIGGNGRADRSGIGETAYLRSVCGAGVFVLAC